MVSSAFVAVLIMRASFRFFKMILRLISCETDVSVSLHL